MSAKSLKNRLGIFVLYNELGFVGKYVYYLLNSIKPLVNQLDVVVNGNIDSEYLYELQNYCDHVFIRENVGFDIGGIREALIEYIGWDETNKYDEIITFNDTFYGPFISFEEIFSEMENRNLDFWGITAHFGGVLDYSTPLENNKIPTHIQSYFIVYNKNVFTSNAFKDFWEKLTLDHLKSFDDCVYNFEVIFTKYLSDNGFKWDTFVDSSYALPKDENSKTYNILIPDIVYLLKNKRLPILKRKYFTTPNILLLHYSIGNEMHDALEFISHNTNYNINLIWEDLLRKNDINAIKRTTCRNYILSSTLSEVNVNKKEEKVAVFIHLFYMDLLDIVYDYVNSIPENFDIYISTYPKENIELIQNKFKDLTNKRIEIRLAASKGRDLGTILVLFKDVVFNYKYICFIHDKKSNSANSFSTVGRSYMDLVWENLLGSKIYINNIISLFEKEPLLGFLSIPFPLHDGYENLIGNEWTTNFQNTVQLFSRFGLNVPINQSQPPFVCGSCFWCRPEAIKNLYLANLSYDDFVNEPMPVDGTISHALERIFPYVAQQNGFYSGIVMTENFAATYIEDLYAFKIEENHRKNNDLLCEDEKEKEIAIKYFKKRLPKPIYILLREDYKLARSVYHVKNLKIKMLEIKRRIKETYFPRGSRKWAIIKLGILFFKNPFQVVKRINNEGITNIIYDLKAKNVDGIINRIEYIQNGNTKNSSQIIIIPLNNKKEKKDYRVIEIPEEPSPVVSIIIPVYNQFNYTYACIKSIFLNSDNIPYEIIVADDCSNDLTRKIDEIIKGIKIIRNPQNLRFLLNCNNASKQAKGKYILFLNNDTQVQKNWLKSLVDLMENDQTIGMSGSKLVYPNETVQEAGGIIWKDGTGMNYGRGMNIYAPECNYIKDVDYISGASIIIRTSLWKNIGGFDESFCPAYYEDTDLAFSVRKAGFRVVYQPKSNVVHFEGISNGKDTSNGQKSFQLVNHDKFCAKWGTVLTNEQLSQNELFVARDRSKNRKTLLMIDRFVPTFDRDAGSRSIHDYLKFFVSQGYNVKFLGDDYNNREPYTTELEQEGIEILYGDYYRLNWKKWVLDNQKYIDYVFMNRAYITNKYIDFMRQNTHAKLIFYGHDLNFMRLERESEITHNSAVFSEAQISRKMELSIIKKADVSYYPSDKEEAILHQIDPSLHVQTIPLFLFTDLVDQNYDFNKRKDIIFVGGFAHKPNADAMVWFLNEVFPIILQSIPDMKIHIVGSDIPSNILLMKSENVLIEGFLQDDELEGLYKKCRLNVVPLRYGAGMKGKIVQSLSCKLPVVTTSIGAEGFSAAEGILQIGDTNIEFANKVIKIYTDENKLIQISNAGYDFVKNNFSYQNAVNILSSVFDFSKDK